MAKPMIAFYGDDFTGSTDAMESLALAGLRTVLLLQIPDPELAHSLGSAHAIGLAGTACSMTPAQMARELPRAFEFLREFEAPIVHYKVCSTFDSSPEIGSIGQAIEAGWPVFSPACVPVFVGAPALGRYCAFGNLFARVNQSSEAYRLDRHPVMSQHPVTPMPEADLRLHLGKQTSRRIGLIDLLQLSQAPEHVYRTYTERVASGDEIVFLDGLTDQDLIAVGRLLWTISQERQHKGPLFVVGSSGVGYTLTAFLARGGAPPSGDGAIGAP